MTAPELVVVGHFARDTVPGGWRPGGAVTYAGLAAHRLGLTVGIVTACVADEPLDTVFCDIPVHRVASPRTTIMQNEYEASGERRQVVPAVGAPITCDDIPVAWRDALVLFAPIIGEVDSRAGDCITDDIAVGLQGFLRDRHEDGAVVPRPFDVGAIPSANFVFLSEEDLAREDRDRALAELANVAPVVVVTRGAEGASIIQGAVVRDIAAFPARVVDPTGAGDVFAAGFLAALRRGCDIAGAARWGSAAAAFAIESDGVAGLADRSALEIRLAAHPEIELS